MKPFHHLTSLLLLLAMLTGCGNDNENKEFNNFTLTDLPQLCVGDSLQGVAAPFAGTFGNKLLVAGGCNFPDTPAAEGGQKRFYADIYSLSADDKSWTRVGQLPRALAASAST